MKTLIQYLVCFLVIGTQSGAAEINWPRWRGPDQNGCAASGTYPVTWEPETALWKIDIPGKGFSTPIVWGKKYF